MLAAMRPRLVFLRMTNTLNVPSSTLSRCREVARKNGLHFVYTGNVHDVDGDTTWCPKCHAKLIVRDWYEILEYRVDARGCCPDCGSALAGRYSSEAGRFGRRRAPGARPASSASRRSPVRSG